MSHPIIHDVTKTLNSSELGVIIDRVIIMDKFMNDLLRAKFLLKLSNRYDAISHYSLDILHGFALAAVDEGDRDLDFSINNNFRSLVNYDPELMTKSLTDFKLRAAIAVSLAIPESATQADRPNTTDGTAFPVDVIKRYQWLTTHNFYFRSVYDLPIWALRHVADTWCSEDELKWAVKNCPAELKASCESIAGAGGKMVNYAVNREGRSVHGKDYYQGNQQTMKILHEYGGVCGAQGKFSSKMSQAHGIPAMPIAQPGHCAVAYRNDKTQMWQTWNGFAGNWDTSTCHTGVHTPWRDTVTKSIWTLAAMEICQAYPQKYLQSEALRTAIGLINNLELAIELAFHALVLSPSNIAMWNTAIDLQNKIGAPKYTKIFQNQELMRAYLRHFDEEICLSLMQPVTLVKGTSCDRFKPDNLTDGTGSEFASKSKECVLFIPVSSPCLVKGINIQYWGTGWGKTFELYNGNAIKQNNIIANQANQSRFPSKCNDEVTIKFSKGHRVNQGLTLVLHDGNGDGFGMGYTFGFRRFDIFGTISQPSFEIPMLKTVAPNSNQNNCGLETMITLPVPTLVTQIHIGAKEPKGDLIGLRYNEGQIESVTLPVSTSASSKHKGVLFVNYDRDIIQISIPEESKVIKVLGDPIGANPLNFVLTASMHTGVFDFDKNPAHSFILNYLKKRIPPSQLSLKDVPECPDIATNNFPSYLQGLDSKKADVVVVAAVDGVKSLIKGFRTSRK